MYAKCLNERVNMSQLTQCTDLFLAVHSAISATLDPVSVPGNGDAQHKRVYRDACSHPKYRCFCSNKYMGSINQS